MAGESELERSSFDMNDESHLDSREQRRRRELKEQFKAKLESLARKNLPPDLSSSIEKLKRYVNDSGDK